MEHIQETSRVLELSKMFEQLAELQEVELALVGGGSGDVCLQ